jgi:hypothetical protein
VQLPDDAGTWDESKKAPGSMTGDLGGAAVTGTPPDALPQSEFSV